MRVKPGYTPGPVTSSSQDPIWAFFLRGGGWLLAQGYLGSGLCPGPSPATSIGLQRGFYPEPSTSQPRTSPTTKKAPVNTEQLLIFTVSCRGLKAADGDLCYHWLVATVTAVHLLSELMSFYHQWRSRFSYLYLYLS